MSDNTFLHVGGFVVREMPDDGGCQSFEIWFIDAETEDKFLVSHRDRSVWIDKKTLIGEMED